MLNSVNRGLGLVVQGRGSSQWLRQRMLPTATAACVSLVAGPGPICTVVALFESFGGQ